VPASHGKLRPAVPGQKRPAAQAWHWPLALIKGSQKDPMGQEHVVQEVLPQAEAKNPVGQAVRLFPVGHM
jgi:hypothetical protein